MNKKIRFSLLTLLVMLCGTVFATKTVYFKPNSNWLQASARFALYMYGGENDAWADFAVVDAENNIYKATFDDDNQTNMIFVRMNGATTENIWDNKWNQTGNLDAPTADNQLYTLADDLWDGATVGSGLTATENYEEPVADTSYKVDFNTTISTSAHDFAVASNWGHVSGYDSKYDSNMSYSWSGTAGVDKTGALLAYRQYKYDWGQSSNGVDVYDLLVTPEVKGTVSLAVKQYSGSNSFIEFYEMTDNGDGTFTRGNIIEYTKDAEEFSQSAYVTVSITVADFARVGIRASYMYLDDFAAEEANIIPEKGITIASADPSATTGTIYWDQQANGKVLVKYTVTVTNSGDVALTQGTEGYSVSIFNRTTEDVYGTTAVPQDLAVGETSEPFVVQAEVESSVWPNTYTYYSIDLRENLKNSVLQRAQSGYKAYQSKFIFREAESTSASSISSDEAWGTITESTTKSFEVYNDGLAPLTINSITLPEGFTSADAPVIPTEGLVINGKEKVTFSVTQDATAQGTFAGTLTIAYLSYGSEQATNYTLNFSATIIGANTWAVDFNNTKSGIVYPAGAIAEAGINSDYDYNSGTYNYWLTGRTQSSYASGNNMFITPKLHANADDKFAYDVKGAYGSSYYAKVYVSTDRKNWNQVAYYTQDETEGAEAIGYTNWYTKTITFDAEGDYYVAFSLYGTFKIDNLVGLEKVDVAHDLYIKSVNWPDASIKSGTAQSKPSVDVIPLTDEVADNYTVKYIYGDNEVVIASKALTASASSTTSFAASFTPSVETTTTFPGTKVVFEFTDGTKFETETFDLTVTNAPIFHFLGSKYTSRWYEPSSDYTTPVNFGKTNTADSKTFWVLNWGSAPLTVKSITVPEGFTASVENMNLPAFDGTQDGLETCQQSFDVTFTATEAGTYNGNLVVTYVNGEGEDATFELAISGTKLDPTKWYANFDNTTSTCNWPAGSVYQSNISGSTGNYSSPYNYYITSTSTTDNIFVTPKLTAAEGDKLQFDAKLYGSSWAEGKVVVYAAATREEVLNAEEGTTRTQLFSVSGQDAENPMTTDYQTFEVPALEGDYYYGFEISNRPYVDEIYGLIPVAVAHDWKIASSNVPTEAMQNVASTATVNILNLGIADEAADSYTVTAYLDGEAVATGEAVAIPMNHKLSDAGTQLSVNVLSTKTGEYPVYIEIKAGEYSVKTDVVNVLFGGEVFVSEAKQVGTQTSTGRDYGFVDWYNNDGSTTKYTDILYPAAKISAAGIKAGDKIKAITFKGSNSAKTFKAVVTSWVGTSTGDITYGTPDKTAMEEISVYNGQTEFAANEESVITLSEPIVWDGTSDIRVYTEAVGQGSGNWLSISYGYDNEITMSYNGTTKAGTIAFFSLEEEAPALSGTVKTSAGAGIEGATITLKAANGATYSGTTVADGSYSFNVIQAGLDFTATVEAEGYLKKEFAYNLGGESKTLNTTMYTQMGIVGGIGDAAGLGFSWDADKVMTQDEENPNIFTVVVPDVEVAEANTKLDYKLRADGAWLGDDYKYELPSSGNNNYVFEVADTYTLTFTANVSEHTLTLTAESNTLKEAIELAEDDDAVAVGKLRKAIEDNPADVAALKDAIEQFNADNAPTKTIGENLTAKVKTAKGDWTGAGGTAGSVQTSVGTTTPLVELYSSSSVGVKMQQTIGDLENGTYRVKVFATSHNARGEDGATLNGTSTEVAYVFAKSGETTNKTWITASGVTPGFLDGEQTNPYTIEDIDVANGELIIGLEVDKEKQTGWHTIQIYSLEKIDVVTAKAAYAAVKANMTAEIAAANAMKNAYRTEGVEAFDDAIAAAEATLTSNMLNVTEFEAEVAKLQAAEATFKQANYILFNGVYYVQNVASGMFMAAGHSWGTQGIVNATGLDLTLTANGNNTVDIDSRVSNGGNSHFLGSNLFMDSSSYGWIIEQTGEDVYTISNGTQFIGVNDNNDLVLSDAATTWTFLAAADVDSNRMTTGLAAMEAATSENPVDATFLIKANNFNRNDARNAEAWTVSEDCKNKNLGGGCSGTEGNGCAESYHSPFTIMQTVSGAPAGIYKLTAQGFYRQDEYQGDAPAAPVFFANEVNGDVPVKSGSEDSMSDASASFTKHLYTIEPIEFVVKEDGMMYVGITASTNTQWVIWDNFQLTYYGVPEITISEDEDFVPVDSKFANVTLERTFSSENWNTFVVPFDIDNATLTEKFGNDVQVAEYSDEGINADNVTVHFDKMDTPAITANVPVLLKTTATAPITFSGVQVKAAAEAKKEGTYFDFVGSYKDQEFVTTGNYYLYENKIYKSTSDNGTFIKGTRAYLKAKEDAGEARIVNFTIGDEIVTGIKVIDANNNAKENIYNLNGQKVNNVKKGLYIKNGQKVMMK